MDVFSNNRFALLAEAETPALVPQTYHLILGTEVIGKHPPGGSSIWGEPIGDERKTSTTSVSFFGKCFECHYMSHSQKYCPLRMCKRCGEFGHAETVCGK